MEKKTHDVPARGLNNIPELSREPCSPPDTLQLQARINERKQERSRPETREAKLMPPGGHTAADRAGGEGADAGYVDYSAEDAEV